ncbi:ATP-dependent metallopeptidase FtsH/Yme1/Tma family protein [Arsenicicoccus piscis]|uniref:AAA+ ATPase domain-containing protein n=3 Tax=Arsenicicoccus piscis TaxID=673954 RepID=A0ABQ6HN24_9MICO|nr:FtsH/Yme1/Tma family ATP-dependent metallopeptidase [Arsenicicoccus piscis]GMA19473.1 hypothetical protein GCM10025862_14940 [Arsenicicoccus piscis]
MAEQKQGQQPRDEADKPKPWRTEGVPDDKPSGASGSGERPPFSWRRFLLTSALIYLGLFGILSIQDSMTGPKEVAYTEFAKQVQAGNVKDVYARGDTIEGDLKAAAPLPEASGGETYTQFTTERPTWADDQLYAELTKQGTIVSAKPVTEQRGLLANLLVSLLPWVLIIGLWVWLMRRQAQAMGGMGGMGMRRKKSAPVDPEKVRVTFDDVAGIDEVENEIADVVDYLKHPDKYRALGARAPKGVLLAGPPGTGKTLLARATAGEASVPFFSASASEFIEMIVGVGAQRVRELFEEARKLAPAIIFIDEIDTIGRARGGSRAMGGHDEREQTLNQILTEMDGFSGSEGVVVLAATNRADVLDPALLRPGRFDRTIMVHAPDAKGRVQILRVHTRSVPLAADVDLDAMAKATPG